MARLLVLLCLTLASATIIRRADLLAAQRRHLQGSASLCPCVQTPDASWQQNATCVVHAGAQHTLPPAYGVGCAAHDAGIGPGCTGERARGEARASQLEGEVAALHREVAELKLELRAARRAPAKS